MLEMYKFKISMVCRNVKCQHCVQHDYCFVGTSSDYGVSACPDLLELPAMIHCFRLDLKMTLQLKASPFEILQLSLIEVFNIIAQVFNQLFFKLINHKSAVFRLCNHARRKLFIKRQCMKASL